MSLMETKGTEEFSSDISDHENQEIKHDETFNKLDNLKLNQDYDFDKEFAELEEMSKVAKLKRTLLQRITGLEVEVNFKNKSHMVWLMGGFASAAGMLSGLDQSIISGASIGMTKSLHLNDHENSLISSLMPLGAVGGSLIISPLNEYLGRKFSIIVSCIWYTIGAAICAGARSHHMLYAGRFCLGVGIGIEGGVGVYLAESVPANVRGNIVSLYQFNIALGEVIGYAVSAMFFEVKGGWRFMMGSSLVFSTLLFIGMFFLPESPRYLVHKGRYGEAYGVWKRLRDINLDENKAEFLEMRYAALQEEERKKNETTIQLWTDLFRIPRNRRALFYAFIMVGLGQLTGVNAVMYYMSTLMAKIGFDTKNSVFMSLVGGGSLLIGTIPAILWMDRFGRRVWGMNIVGFFIGLVLVGVGYLFDPITQKAAAEGVYLSGIVLYFMFFGAYATLTWVIPSESFDLRTRSIGMSVCTCMVYVWSFTVTYNFTEMQKAMTYTGLTLGFYGGIAFLGFIYQVIFMPETKDKTLEEIDDIFSRSSFSIAGENIRNMKSFWRKKD